MENISGIIKNAQRRKTEHKYNEIIDFNQNISIIIFVNVLNTSLKN